MRIVDLELEKNQKWGGVVPNIPVILARAGAIGAFVMAFNHH